MANDLRDIALKHNASHALLGDILGFLRKYNIGDMPKCSKTLLQTPQFTSIRSMPPGSYWHNGLTKHVFNFAEQHNCTSVNIAFSVDGVPIASSSGASFYPLTCSFNDRPEVYLVGAYYGVEKPSDSNDFFKDFVDEAKYLCSEGIHVQGKVIPIKIKCGIFDAPAKSFAFKTKGHNGYFGCSKCEVEGEMLGRRMSYQECDSPLRTDESFKNQSQEEYHKGETILLDVPGLGPVSCVPLDYMHLLLLGVLRKIIYMLIQGPLTVRLKAADIEKISDKLKGLTDFIPREFVRKPRSLRYVKRFKATEYRQILFYTVIIVFKSILPQKIYEHFLVFHAATTILANSCIMKEKLQYARELLLYFVETFKLLYGAQYVSHNVHGCIHIADDVERFGPLDSFSAFKYENFLQTLIKLVRKGDKPLQQLARRYGEKEKASQHTENCSNLPAPHLMFHGQHVNGPLVNDCTNPQFSSFTIKKSGFRLLTNNANHCCGLLDGSIVCVENFACGRNSSDMFVVGRKFRLNHEFLVVDFQDGTQVIPAAWFDEERKVCAWPPWESNLDQRQYDKRVVKKEEVGPEWTDVAVVRVRARGANFQYVRQKLTQAQDCSDTDLKSGQDNLKTRKFRHVRNKRSVNNEHDSRGETSDEEDKGLSKSVGSKIVLPSFDNSKCKSSSSNLHLAPEKQSHIIMTADKRLSYSSSQKIMSDSASKNTTSVQKEGFSSERKVKTVHTEKTDFCAGHELLMKKEAIISQDGSNSYDDVSLVTSNSATPKAESNPRTSAHLAARMTDIEFRTYIISALSALRNSIHETKMLVKSVSSARSAHGPTDESSTVRRERSGVEDALCGLPAITIAEFIEFDKRLKSDDNFSNNVEFFQETALALTGGDSLPSVVRKMLSTVLSNGVAVLYSWCGSKGKFSFQELEFKKVLFRAVRQMKGREKELDKSISTPASDWLRLAKQRARGSRQKKAVVLETSHITPHKATTMTLRSSTKKDKDVSEAPSHTPAGLKEGSSKMTSPKSTRKIATPQAGTSKLPEQNSNPANKGVHLSRGPKRKLEWDDTHPDEKISLPSNLMTRDSESGVEITKVEEEQMSRDEAIGSETEFD